MGLRRVLGGLPERFGVLREPCEACLGDHFGSKDGLRRFRVYGALLASAEAERRRILGDEKWNESDGSRLSSKRARKLFRRAGQVGLRPHSQACMWSYRESSVAVVCERPRVGLCNGVLALVLFSFVLFGGGALGSAAGGRRPLESADPRGPACASMEGER